MSNLSRLMILAIVATLAAAPANADSVKFYSGTTGYTGVFSGAGSVIHQHLQSASVLSGRSASGGCGSTDVVSTPQSYTASSNITASSSTSAVWADLSPNFAGLGVGNGSPSDDDQIFNGDILTTSSTPRSSSRASGRVSRRQSFGSIMPSNTGPLAMHGVSHSFQMSVRWLVVLPDLLGRYVHFKGGVDKPGYLPTRRYHQFRFQQPSRSSPPASVRWVCSAGAGSGRPLL